MEFLYYIGEGPEADTLIAEAKAKLSERNEARHQLCTEYGAQGVVGNRSNVSGLVFEEKQDAPHLKLTKQANGYFWYAPRRNSKTGKTLAAKLGAKDLSFDVSDHIVGTLGLHRMVVGKHQGSRTGMAMYLSVAGFSGKKIIVKVPADTDDGDPIPTVPAWLRTVKESEFLAAQGR